LHKVRRLAGVLVSSQLRSGRSSSDPQSVTGRPAIIALLDGGLFVAAFSLGWAVLGSASLPTGTLRATVYGLLPFLPLAAVAVVVIAGTMFELTVTARFSGSDAVNWMPITPAEYVVSSASAVAFTYSPAIALLLGALFAAALAAAALAAYALTFALSALALFEGALLVEMIRSVSNRAGSLGSGHRGSATFVLRAIALVAVILVLDLALNPVFLFDAVQRLSAFPAISAAIPLFWSSRALSEWVSGQYPLGVAFALGQVGFVGILGLAAARLRVRYWVPAVPEVRLSEYRYERRRYGLASLGLSRPEGALVSKDLKGFGRRREMMPLLVVPVVLVLLLLVEGGGFGALGTVLWVGWVTGFFGLLLSLTAVGQERRALQQLLAFPLTSRELFRAKFTANLIPVVIGSAAISLGVGWFVGFTAPKVAGLLLLNVGGAIVLTLWGLAFASRYSDFQERPRPQFLRPSAMIGATVSGVVLLFAILVPGALALAEPSVGVVEFAAASVAIAIGVGAVALSLARSGFDALVRELPF
ncbi:MAG: hypothetical protein ACREEC_12065, partial [Thermoplasmata archaeon]